jgi:predicted Zn finger-like uncharacterized protein
MKTQCPNCKARFNVNDKFIGKQAKCPKCTKPFTIEALIEQPVAVETPAKSAVPVETPVKKAEPIQPPAKSPEPAPPAKVEPPVEPPATISKPVVPPVKSMEAAAPPAKSAAPIASPQKSPEPIAPPVKSPKPVETPAKSAEPVKEEKLKTKALSKTVFVYCWMVVRIIAGILGALGLMLAIRKGGHSTLIATFAAADVFLVCSVLIELMLYYRMWAAIRDSEASTTPAKAIGLLFVPAFNIYWALLMFTGFVEDYNAFIHRRSLKAKDLSFILFLIYAFVFILAGIVLTTPMICVFAFVRRISGAFISYPDLSWALFFIISAVGIFHFITYILIAIKTCNAINALPERKSG